MTTNLPPQNGDTIRAIKRLCVFCGSSSGVRPIYAQAAVHFGRLLANAAIDLVYGGGRVGLMGALADSVMSSGGRVTGVIPRALLEKELANQTLTELRVVATMHERKALMADLSDAFVLLPGGFGSWDEFCEIVTWNVLGIHRKPCGVLNVEGYYDSLLALTSHAVSEGFVRAAHEEMVIVEDDPAALLARLSTAPIPSEVKWVGKTER